MRLRLVCTALCIVVPIEAYAELWNLEDFSPKANSVAYWADHTATDLALSRWALSVPSNPPSVIDDELATPEQRPPRAFSKIELCSTAASVAKANRLPVPFFTNLIHQESGFKPHAVSPAGAQGIAQFMPRVAASYGLENPFDPIQALATSGRFLAELVARFGNLGLAAAAYNAGPKRVRDWMARRGKLPAETRNYVKNITGRPAEQWTRSAAKAAQASLPAHARCPDVPAIEAEVAAAPSVMAPQGVAGLAAHSKPAVQRKAGQFARNKIRHVLAAAKPVARAAALRVRPSVAAKRVRLAAVR